MQLQHFKTKGDEIKKYKPEIGIDMGIKTSITTSEGKKIKVFVGETERLKKIQHSILGLVKAKLIRNERVVVLPKSVATTKTCPKCGRINNDITLSDRIFECQCGYREDGDIHAARNMILLSKINKNTCGTQGINAFGEDVRREHEQKCCNADLDELGSPRFYKRG